MSDNGSGGSKGAFALIVVIALIGLKVWVRWDRITGRSSSGSQVVVDESVSISGEECMEYSFEWTGNTNMKLDITQSNGQPYRVFMVDDENYENAIRLSSMSSKDKTLEQVFATARHVFNQRAESDKTFYDQQLKAGKYHLYITPTNNSQVACQLKIVAR